MKGAWSPLFGAGGARSEEHMSELQSRLHLVCRLLLEKKKLFRSDRKSTRLNSSHGYISYPVFCFKKKNHTIQVVSCSACGFNVCVAANMLRIMCHRA